MEALPTMPLMAPQFRTSTLSYDNIPNFDFRLRMKEYILLTFNADPHDYDGAFDELSQMKFEANIPAATAEQAHKLKKYYNQLCMMQKRFPMAAGEQMETPFAWHDGLVDMRSAQSEVTICDIEFEKASVMFNIGTCHAQCAAEQMRDSQESIKTAFSHLQQATIAFEQLNTFRNSDFFYPSVDLDANVISFYYKVLLAQSQECLVQKSLLENRSPILIAKLCLWIQEAYDSATKIVDDWSVNIPESVQRFYSKLCRLKSDIYAVIGYMSMGDHSEKEEKKMGWRLQYYNIANKYMEHLTMNNAKMRDRYPELFITSSFLFDVISAKQKNAEKENDFIYHDRVPKQEDAVDTALKDGVRCIVDLKKVNLMNPAGYGPDLFARLLPSFVQEATQKYQEKKDEILHEMKEIVKSYDDHLIYQLELAEFDKLRFMLTEGKNREAWFEITEDLMRRNADMTSYPDCVPNLIEKLRESSDTARVAEAKLNTLLAKLRAVDLPRLKADEGFNLIQLQKELERLGEHLEQAKANNVSLNKAIAQHSANLQLLTLPCMEMWQKIVPVDEEETAKNSSVMSDQEKRMHEMVNKVLEMMDQRKSFIQQLESALNADDISSKMIGTNERGAEEIMYKELEKHSDAQKLIRLNATAQDAILRAFTDANADFFEERSEMSTKKQEYDKRVTELCASYEVYRDVQRKCEEGEQFYRQLMARCDQFAIPVHAMEEQYREELQKKEKAQKEAEHHMNQLRMSREAQNALMDFGRAAGAPRHGSMGPPGAGYPPQMMPPGPTPRGNGPRLGDFLDSYRARKQNPNVQIPQDAPNMDHGGGGGPPSPTPSSICDFPMSSSRSQRFGGGGGGYQGQVSPNPGQLGQFGGPQGPQGYQESQGPQGGPQGYQPPQGSYGGPQGSQRSQREGFPGQTSPNSAKFDQFGSQGPHGPSGYGGGGPLGPPAQAISPNPAQFGSHGPQGSYGGSQGYHGPPQLPHQLSQSSSQSSLGHQQGYQGGPQYQPTPYLPPAPIAPGTPAYQHATSPYPGPPSSYQVPRIQPGYAQTEPGGPFLPIQGAPGGTGGQYQVPGGAPRQEYAPSPVQGGPGTYPAPGYPPPLHHSTPYTPPPAPVPSYQAPPTSIAPGYPGAQGYAPPPAPVAQNHPYQAPPTLPPAPTTPGSYPGSVPSYQAPPTSIAPPTPVQGVPGYPGAQGYAPPPASVAPTHPYQAPPTLPPAPASVAPPPSSVAPPPPQYPSYQPVPPPAQPTYQHPPQGPPISAPPPSQQQQFHQHVAPMAPGEAPSAQQQAPNHFKPTPGAPSPWHATPAELKTPWNTTPQYHAPNPSTPGTPGAPPPPSSTSTSTTTHPPGQSNVDLLSDLLGDFNLPPPIQSQPQIQNTQHLQQQHSQQQAPPTSSMAPPPPQQQQQQAPPPTLQSDFRMAYNPPEPPSKPFVRPAAAVQPMPQMTTVQPELSQIAQQHVLNTLETPILIKGSPSLTELSDPTKFQMGEGNVQKLEKRMLHQSFRTNGPPPPLNQSDPLNQIDAFSFNRQK